MIWMTWNELLWCGNNENEMQLKIYLNSIIHEDWKVEKLVRKAEYNLFFTPTDSFKINLHKTKGNELILVAQLSKKLSSSESDQ